MTDNEAVKLLRKRIALGLKEYCFTGREKRVSRELGVFTQIIDIHITRTSSITIGFYWAHLGLDEASIQGKQWYTHILAEVWKYWVLGKAEEGRLSSALSCCDGNTNISMDEVVKRTNIALNCVADGVLPFMDSVTSVSDFNDLADIKQVVIWSTESDDQRQLTKE